jgi:hypothetical protein
MTAETNNAREWVLVPREPSADMWDAAENAMIEAEALYNAGDQDARSDAHGFPTMRIWQAVVGYRAMLAAVQQPPPAARVDVRIIARDIHYAIMDDGLAPLSNADNHKVREAILRVLQAAIAAEGVQAGEVEKRVDEESRVVSGQLLHWGGVPVHVTGTVTTSPRNWSLIDAALTGERNG